MGQPFWSDGIYPQHLPAKMHNCRKEFGCISAWPTPANLASLVQAHVLLSHSAGAHRAVQNIGFLSIHRAPKAVKNSCNGTAPSYISVILMVTASAALTACATRPPADDPFAVAAFEEANDPLEPLNRMLFKADQALDKVLVLPIITGYRAVVPDCGRKSVNNFMNHIRSPIILLHDVLQGDVKRAGDTMGRIVVNSTVGVFGLFDVGEQIGLPHHTEDFGQTMAVWGAEEGPYFYVPLFGPSNFRDWFGFIVDAFLVDPLSWFLGNPRNNLKWAQWGRFGMLLVTTKDTTMDATDELQKSSLDYYAALRSAYRQIRADEIRNGAPAPLEYFDDFEDFAEMGADTRAHFGEASSVLPETQGTLANSN